VKRFNISGYTALIELSSTGIPLSGRWLNDEEELTDDELADVAEAFAEDCREWAEDNRAEEEYDRRKDCKYE
jgi:hypothetical protein